MRAFLSHNSRDKQVARRLGAQLKLVGADVWFDEWEIRAGDSIPGKVGEALDAWDTFILIWSEHASLSEWVKAEVETALTRAIRDKSLRVIPIVLDDSPLPALLQPLRRLTLEDVGVSGAVDEIMGFRHDRDRLRAIQSVLDEADIEVEDVPGYGLVVACPRCGAGVEMLRGWTAVDERRDDTYAGVRCQECGWSGGGEV